jgi:hypothetical protein
MAEEEKAEAPVQQTEEEAKQKWEAMSVDEKINTIANNAMSRQEAYQRMEGILEKVQTIAVRLENLELKQKLEVQDGGKE